MDSRTGKLDKSPHDLLGSGGKAFVVRFAYSEAVFLIPNEKAGSPFDVIISYRTIYFGNALGLRFGKEGVEQLATKSPMLVAVSGEIDVGQQEPRAIPVALEPTHAFAMHKHINRP